MSTEYAIILEKFAERHFVNLFEKKYKKKWGITLRAIVAELQRIDALLGRNAYIETICADVGGVKILKMEFRVAGTQESRRTSGNRCIVALHTDTGTAHVLLVYGKTDVRGHRETDWWKGVVKEHYPRYRRLL